MLRGNLLNMSQTPMQKIYENTAMELIKDLSKDIIEDKPIHDSFTNVNGLGNFVEEIIYTKQIEDIVKKYHNPTIQYPTENTAPKYKAFKNFPAMMELTKVGNGNLSINEALEMAGNIYKEIGKNLYGVLLMNAQKGKKKQIINIFHPFVSTFLLNEKNKDIRTEKKWTAVFYSFRQDKLGLFKNSNPFIFDGDKTIFMREIAYSIAALQFKSDYYIKNSNLKVDIEDNEFVLNYEQQRLSKKDNSVINESENNGRNFIIPGQVINIGGVAYPYYGLIYSRKGLAWNMCPMYGANISHPKNQSTSNGMMGGSRICTHSGNSKTQKGLSSLNHCNTSSPLNSYIMNQGSMLYAQTAMAGSIELLLGKEYAIHAEEDKKILTMQEFLTNDKTKTKKDYIKYLKTRIDKEKKEPKKRVRVNAPSIKPYIDGEIYDFNEYVMHKGIMYRSLIHGAVIEPEPDMTATDGVWLSLGEIK